MILIIIIVGNISRSCRSDLPLLVIDNICNTRLQHGCHYVALKYFKEIPVRYPFTSPGSGVAHIDQCLAEFDISAAAGLEPRTM